MNSPRAYGELQIMIDEAKTAEGRVMMNLMKRIMQLEDRVELLEKKP